MRSLDEKLFKFAQDNDLIYTRYADDLIFSSGSRSTEPFRRHTFLPSTSCYVQRVTGPIGPKPKSSPWNTKSRVGIAGRWLGAEADQTHKKYVRDHLYYLSHPEISPELHAKRKGFRSLQGLINHVSGKIAYGISIEPEWGRPRRKAEGNLPEVAGRSRAVPVMLFCLGA